MTLYIFCFLTWLGALYAFFDEEPLFSLPNRDTRYSLINSVAFHPKENLFCAAYTQNDKICLYQIDEEQKPYLMQMLQGSSASLCRPQHAAFSSDGEKLAVANWRNQTFTLYRRGPDRLFSEVPEAIIPSPPSLLHCKPHGIAFSPCGNLLAVAYGAGSPFEKAIALFEHKADQLNCMNVLKNQDLPGIPKGIHFSPDGTHLLVTFCEPDSLAVFSITEEKMALTQLLQEKTMQIFRPEDVKVSPCGRYVALSNSSQDTIHFYLFDQKTNKISQNSPFWSLQNPKAKLSFPHSLAFSPDGQYLAITQFGPVQIKADGGPFWKKEMKACVGTIHVYRYNEAKPLPNQYF